MQAVVGTPTQAIQKRTDLETRYWGDGNTTGVVRMLDRATQASIPVGFGAVFGGIAASRMLGDSAPAVMLPLLAVGALGFVAMKVAPLVMKDETHNFHLDVEALKKESPDVDSSAAVLNLDERAAAEWMRRGFFRQQGSAVQSFEQEFQASAGRDPRINWLKVATELGNRKLVDFAAARATGAELQDALTYIAARGNVATAISERVSNEGVDRMHPDRVQGPADTNWLDEIKEKVTGLFASARDEGAKSAFSGATSAWRSDASSILGRVADRHNGRRESEAQRAS
ncbi:hypothetical protein [Variovorax ginsengisoli]|uniref:Uncharacterized protein n=1 Tax=Variovorax ginsengisoli TaxID=363844 RepID=A0ABT8SBV1_9BURK|nr:hypothetical protein [Variovorax ginsengisoli]MDN8617227.1 hypothetical protein [Variovorax ginsengisoli]MDO1536397.1 hypothetical protein [Variovorax ginsengisoli]